MKIYKDKCLKIMSKRYTSFVLGVVITSITWIFSLYLYSKLSQNLNTTHPTMFTAEVPKNDDNLHKFKSNRVQDQVDQKNNDNFYNKNSYNYKGGREDKMYKNSEKLLKQLQPVPVIKSSTTGQGLDELGMVKTVEEQIKRDEGYKNFAFNVLVSDKLSLQRALPDTRHRLCQNETYPSNLPNTSVIICFYNEHYTTLIRSLHSIIDRTPADLLHEIILVNDFSDSEKLHQKVEEYVKQFSTKVKYFKTEKREGLIRARIFGSRKATGKVLVFLDSHIEVNTMWLEPLLARIAKDKTIVPMPVIDIINADTFNYSSSPLVRGGFNWGLHFKWDNLPVGTLAKNEDFVKPIK